MGNNQYITPNLHLVKPQPGSTNYGPAINENFNKIDEGFSRIINSYNNAIKKIEGSRGYVAVEADTYFYVRLDKDRELVAGLCQLDRDVKTTEIDDEDLKTKEITVLDQLNPGAYVLIIEKYDESSNLVSYKEEEIKIALFGNETWADNDIVLIQHVWRSSESRYEPLAVKMPHLSGGYYIADNNGYKYVPSNKTIQQTLVKQSVAEAQDNVQTPLPYVTYEPDSVDDINGCINFRQYIYLPTLDENKNVYMEKQETDNIISSAFRPIDTHTTITTIDYNLDNYELGRGYPTGIKVEESITSNGFSYILKNQLEIELSDAYGNLIFANYIVEQPEGCDTYYITNSSNDFYLPNNSKIHLIVHSTTNNVRFSSNAITNTQINGLGW